MVGPSTKDAALRYRVRKGTPADGEGLLRVHRISILRLATAAYSAAEVASWTAGLVAEGYGRAMTERGETFYTALTDDSWIVGFCSYKVDEVVGLYIDPDWARRGLGSDLLRRAEAAIAAAGHRTIRIGASLTGRPFYEAHGYRVVRHGDWKTRGGLVIDMVDMEKSIAEA